MDIRYPLTDQKKEMISAEREIIQNVSVYHPHQNEKIISKVNDNYSSLLIDDVRRKKLNSVYEQCV